MARDSRYWQIAACTMGRIQHGPSSGRKIRDVFLIVLCASTCIHTFFYSKRNLMIFAPHHEAASVFMPTEPNVVLDMSYTNSTYRYTSKKPLESSTPSTAKEKEVETETSRSKDLWVSTNNEALDDARTLRDRPPSSQMDSQSPRCAINLYGLPRSFSDHVLPSLVKNVIRINAKHN
jgi:hypothetical protein